MDVVEIQLHPQIRASGKHRIVKNPEVVFPSREEDPGTINIPARLPQVPPVLGSQPRTGER